MDASVRLMFFGFVFVQVYEDKQPVDLGLQVLTCKMDQHIPSPGIQNIDVSSLYLTASL